MIKEEQDTQEQERREQIRRVKALVGEAGEILKSISPDHARVGWLLEDALTYLEEIDESSFKAEPTIGNPADGLQDMQKAANVSPG